MRHSTSVVVAAVVRTAQPVWVAVAVAELHHLVCSVRQKANWARRLKGWAGERICDRYRREWIVARGGGVFF